MPSPNTITLEWDAMGGGESWTEVRIYANGSVYATAYPPSTSIEITKAPYFFTARAWDGANESVDSNPVAVMPFACFKR